MRARGIVWVAVLIAGLLWSIATRFWPLVAFLLTFGPALILIRRRPDTAFARVLSLPFGPREIPGEPRSRYLLRCAAHALVAFVVLAGETTAGAYAFRRQIEEGNPGVAAVFCFGLPILAGMAALAMVALLAEAAYLRLSGRDQPAQRDQVEE